MDDIIQITHINLKLALWSGQYFKSTFNQYKLPQV